MCNCKIKNVILSEIKVFWGVEPTNNEDLTAVDNQDIVVNELEKIELSIEMKKNQFLSIDELIKTRFIGQEVCVC